MKEAIKQVTEHHFGNHSNSWCRVRELRGLEREEADLKYQNTSDGKKCYDDARVIVHEFAPLMVH
jgi:hypothetical protein